MSNWQSKLIDFCVRYNIPVDYITEVLDDPKVIPMIRGKAFEFSVKQLISNILPSHTWEVSNTYINAQTNIHDVDVKIFHKGTEKIYSVECKLSGKGSYKRKGDSDLLRIKCMRSRTLGEAAALQRARTTGFSFDSLMIHNDQYIPSDFDLVVTSIGNAFYETDSEGLFYFDPCENGIDFLKKLNAYDQEKAFNKMFVARSVDLVANTRNAITCSRQKCNNPNCGFIPNYPYMHFDTITNRVIHPWYPIEEIEALL
mgnify:CR=1 FL=1